MNQLCGWPWLRFLLLGLALIFVTNPLTGCGYRLIGATSVAPQRFTVAVPIFRNFTYRPVGEGVFTEAVIQALLRQGVAVQDVAIADYVVSGEISLLSSTGDAFSATDAAVLYRAEVEMEVTIRQRQEQRVLVRERIRQRVEFPAQALRALQGTVDEAAREELARQVGQVVFARLAELGGEHQP